MSLFRLFSGMATLWLAAFAAGFQALPARAEPPPITIGFHSAVIRDLPRKDVEISLRFWTEELARSVGLTYRPVRIYDSLAELKRDVDNGQVQFFVTTAMGMIQHFSPDELADGFSGYPETPGHLLLVVRRDAGIHGPADLAGKRVALLEGDELSDIYLETLMLKAWGKGDWKRLGAVIREKRGNKLAHRLFFDQADAALIYQNNLVSSLALNPQLSQRLHTLDDYTFRIRAPHIGLLSARVRPEDRETYIQAALKLNDTVRGRQVLQLYLADSIVRTSVRDLAPFRELLETHRALLARGQGKSAAGGK